MTTAALLLRRARDASAVLAALGLVVLVGTLSLALVIGFVSTGIASGSRTALADAAAQASAIRITTHLADDATAQREGALALLTPLFPADVASIEESERSLPTETRIGTASPVSAVFGVEPHLDSAATITAGSWPNSSADAVAVQADAAEALGLTVGDAVTVGDVGLTVAALWRATDPQAPRWFADSTVAAGRDGAAFGLFVVEPTTAVTLPTQLFVSWTVIARPAAVLDDATLQLRTAIDGLPADVKPSAFVEESFTIEGTLGATLERIATASRGAAAIATSAACIVAVLALVALLQLCAVLVGSRRRQSTLLRARGLSGPQIIGLSTLEAVVIALPAGVIGAGAAAAIVTALSGAAPDPVALAAVVAGLVLATLACLTGTALRSERAESAGTSAVPFLIGSGVLGIAALLASWQLHTNGSPVSVGSGGVDVVSATSPALTVVAASSLGAALVIPLAAALARGAARRGSVEKVLATRQLARRTARYLVPVLALAIAVAGGGFASAIGATWAATGRTAHLVETGATVSASLATGDTATDETTPVTSPAFSALDGADAASALVISTASLGDDTVALVAVRPHAAREALGDDGRDLARALEAGRHTAGIALPADARTVSATISIVRSDPARYQVSLWVADADGSLARVPLVGAGSERTGMLPDGAGAWTALAVESVRTGRADAAATLTASNFATATGGDPTPIADAPEIEVDVNGSTPKTRSVIGDDEEEPLPIVVTDALAQRIGLAVGDTVTLELGSTGNSFDASVAALVATLPGADSLLGLAVDLGALDAASLRTGLTPVRTTEVWIDTAAPERVAAAITRLSPVSAQVSTPAGTSSGAIISPAIAAFWIAAGAAAVLALIALAAFLLDDGRERRADLAVLRALGFTSVQQGRIRAHEQRIVLSSMLVIGAVAGVVCALATVAPFAAAAVPGAAAPTRIAPTADPLLWLAFVAALVVGALAVSWAAVGRVRRSAASSPDAEGDA